MRCKAAIIEVLAAAGILLASPQGASGAETLLGVGTGGINGVYYPLGGAICRLVNAGRMEHGRLGIQYRRGNVRPLGSRVRAERCAIHGA